MITDLLDNLISDWHYLEDFAEDDLAQFIVDNQAQIATPELLAVLRDSTNHEHIQVAVCILGLIGSDECWGDLRSVEDLPDGEIAEYAEWALCRIDFERKTLEDLWDWLLWALAKVPAPEPVQLSLWSVLP